MPSSEHTHSDIYWTHFSFYVKYLFSVTTNVLEFSHEYVFIPGTHQRLRNAFTYEYILYMYKYIYVYISTDGSWRRKGGWGEWNETFDGGINGLVTRKMTCWPPPSKVSKGKFIFKNFWSLPPAKGFLHSWNSGWKKLLMLSFQRGDRGVPNTTCILCHSKGGFLPQCTYHLSHEPV